MTVRIVTDSSACLPPDIAEQRGIAVVPIGLSLDGDDTRPVDAVGRRQLLDHLAGGGRATTSAPSPGAFLEAIEGQQEGDGVVVLTLAATMSSTHDAARMAATMADGPVRVVDSGTAAGGLALVAVAAQAAATGGASLDEVERVVRDVSERVRLVAAVGSLDALARSGRVPALASKASDALGVRPLFEFREGKAHLLVPAFSAEAGRNRLVERWRESVPEEEATLHVAALHADDADEAGWLLDQVSAEVEPATSFVAEFDAAMLAHTGTDVVGLAWWWQPDPATS